MDTPKQTGRLEAFSDGVFAIAITLLVLDLKVPEEPPLLDALLHQWPVYVAYLVSFLFILIMWMNHHRMFESIARVDSTFMLLNGLLLLGITVVPYPTNILSRYVLSDEQTVATAVYSGWFLLLAVCFNLMWRYAAAGGRLLDSQDAELARVITARYRWGIPSYFAAFALAFIWAPGSLLLNALLAIFYAIPRETKLDTWRH